MQQQIAPILLTEALEHPRLSGTPARSVKRRQYLERVRQNSNTHLADSLFAANLFFAMHWDESSRETAKYLGIRGQNFFRAPFRNARWRSGHADSFVRMGVSDFLWARLPISLSSKIPSLAFIPPAASSS